MWEWMRLRTKKAKANDMFGANKTTVARLKEQFPKGCRVQLDRMLDDKAPPEGTYGTVRNVDDVGTIHVNWDNGSGLGVCYGEDRCHRI